VVNEEDILDTDHHLRYNNNSCSDTEINRQIVSVPCKRKATENLYIQPKKKKNFKRVTDTENIQLADGSTSNDFNVIRKSINRSRLKFFL